MYIDRMGKLVASVIVLTLVPFLSFVIAWCRRAARQAGSHTGEIKRVTRLINLLIYILYYELCQANLGNKLGKDFLL
jgi:hypothetical protein